MAHSVPFFRTRTGPAWGSERGREKGAPAGSSWDNTDPFRGHLLFQIAGRLPSPGYLGTGVLGQAERERGPVYSFPQCSLVHSFLIHSFPQLAPHSFIHRAPPFMLPRVHSFPGRPPSPPRLPSARGAPRPQACPSVPQPVRPAWALRGEPRNQPRLRARPGLAGSRAGGGGRALPAGSQAGLGEPRPRRGSGRARPRRGGCGPGAAAAAAAGPERGGGGGCGGAGEPRGCPGAMWTGGRRPGRLRRAVSTSEPGGQGAGAGTEAGRAPPTRQRGLGGAAGGPRAPSREGGDCPASAPPPVAPPPVPVRGVGAGGPGHECFARRGGHSQGGARTRPRRAALPPAKPARAPGT